MKLEYTKIVILFIIFQNIQNKKKFVEVSFRQSKKPKNCFEMILKRDGCSDEKIYEIEHEFEFDHFNDKLKLCPGYTSIEDQQIMLGALLKLDDLVTYQIPFGKKIKLKYDTVSSLFSSSCNYNGFKEEKRYHRYDEAIGSFDVVLYLKKTNSKDEYVDLEFSVRPFDLIFEDYRNQARQNLI